MSLLAARGLRHVLPRKAGARSCIGEDASATWLLADAQMWPDSWCSVVLGEMLLPLHPLFPAMG